MNNLNSSFIESSLGLTFENEKCVVFFGNRDASFEKIEAAFPDLSFHRIKQTHSDLFIESSNEVRECDGHFSAQKKTGLVIASADCLPVLIECKNTGQVAAIHAGWKGVANQIVYKALNKLVSEAPSKPAFDIWIGPHILQKSFEVDLDVLQKLQKAAFHLSLDSFSYKKNEKYYVDLNKILESQIQEIAAEEKRIQFINFDTKNDPRFFSFRRDKEKAGRNLSFIAAL